MKRFFIVLLVLLVLIFVFRRQISTQGTVLLLTAQEFGQIPIKPLDWVTRRPDHLRLVVPGPRGPIVADLFLPRPWLGTPARHSEPAIIMAMGVQLTPSAQKQLLRFGSALARLGYVAVWPRRRALANRHAPAELPSTFVTTFEYLSKQPRVNPRRISFLGFSVGASTALVAAADPRINRQVHAFVFFAGYYNLRAYLLSLATGKDTFQGREVGFHPSSSAIQQVKQVVRGEGAPNLVNLFHTHTSARARKILEEAPPVQLRRLQRFNPAAHIHEFLAPTFILDDRHDAYVPYVESEKLDRTLPRRQVKAMLLTDLFQHVIPGPGNLRHLAGGLLGFDGFAYSVFGFL